MDSLDYWRLCEDLSIVQAALLLVAGENPSLDVAQVEQMSFGDRPSGYEAAKNAISQALMKGLIEGSHIPEYLPYITGSIKKSIEGSIDIHKSTVNVNSLRAWLQRRGFVTGFFFPAASNIAAYLDSSNPHYPPKLAAAVRAWEAVTTDQTYSGNGRTVKQNLVSWLTARAAELELLRPDGEINNDAIENQVAKVANWQDRGGAPKTPGG